MKRLLSLMPLVLLAIPLELHAATREVGSGKAYVTIQSAVNVAVPGDTVLVYPGTYREAVRIPDGMGNTASVPITLRALYPARAPLDGRPWADQTSERSVIDATGLIAGIYNDCYCSSTRVGNLIIDGFYITGAASAGFYFVFDHDLWIRNNMVVNCGTGQGENWGAFVLNWTNDCLIQNNYAEFSTGGLVSDAALFGVDGANNILEFNECHVRNGVANSGRCAYVHGGCTNFIFRYNYILLENLASAQYARFRDAVNFTIQNNYIHSTTAQYFFVIHENSDHGLVEGHHVNRNTFLYDGGTSTNFDALGLGYQTQTQVANNIFVSGVTDNDSHFAGPAWTSPSASVSLQNNITWGYLPGANPALGGYTETGTLNQNPAVNAGTGCAGSADNNQFGANMDVSTIPFRRCDGAALPFATKFAPGAADAVAPSAPRDLTAQ